MQDFENQGGIAFLIIYFSERNVYYYLPYRQLVEFWNRSKTGHAKSFKFSELDDQFIITVNGYYVHYLEMIQKDLDLRDN